MVDAESRPFSDAEMQRRRAAFAALLERMEVPYALVYGANRSGSAVSWLTGWPVTREALLVVGPKPVDDVLLVNYYNHVPQARAMSQVTVGWAGARAVDTAMSVIERRGRRPRRIGVAGPLTFDQHAVVADAVDTVIDLNRAYTELRLVKSGEEIDALERAAGLTDAAMAALVDGLRPGVTEHELLASVQSAYLAKGGLHHICYLGSTPMADPALAVPRQWPTGRRIEPRDVVLSEISAAVAPEYAGQILRTCVVNGEPTPLFADMHAVAVAAFEAVSKLLYPGTPARELAAAGSLISDAGFTIVDDLVHGFGGGYLPPVVRLPARGVGGASDLTLAAGMTVVVQPNVVTPDGRAGVQTGELLVVTGSGPRRLHTFPPGLQLVG